MAALISLGGIKMSCTAEGVFDVRCGGFAIGADEAVAVAVQIEAAGDEILAGRGRFAGRCPRKAPVLAVELHELAGHSEAGQVLEKETALAPAAEREFADQLLVPGFLAGGGGDPGEQFAIGHTPRLRQVESRDTLLRAETAQKTWTCRRMGVTRDPGGAGRLIRPIPGRTGDGRGEGAAASGLILFGFEPLALPWHPQSSADRKGRNP